MGAPRDFSGMGESDWWQEGYAMEVLGREEIGGCEHAGMFEPGEPPIIVAHSFGGFVTMLTGGLYGDRLAGVVIVDSPVNPPDRPGGPPKRQIKPHNVYPSLAAAMAPFRLMPPHTSENLYLVDSVPRHSPKE